MPVARSGLSATLTQFLALSALTLASVAHADTDLVSEATFFDNVPYLSAATRLRQKQSEIPAAVTLIDRQMIETSGAVTIADLLRLVPGFQVAQVNANKHAVVSHGQGEPHPGRLEVMIDGRSVYSAIVSTVDWRALGISLNDIDHIEVVRGSNVVTHGSNAFLGAINIITRQPLQDRGTQLSVLAGDLGTREYTVGSSGRIGDLDLRFSGGFLKNDGTGDGDDNDPVTGQPVRVTIEDGGEISQLALRGLYTPSLSDTLDFHLGISHGQFGMGNATHPLEFADREVDTNFQNLTWTRALDNGNQLRLQGYHNYTRYNQDARQWISQILADSLNTPIPVGTPVLSWADISGLSGIPESVLQVAIPNLDQIAGEPDQLVNLDAEEGSTHRYDLELEYSGELNPQTRLIGGIGWRLDQIKSVPQLNTDSYITDPFYRLFGNLEWQPSAAWTFNSGAMLEYNGLIGGRLSPRLGANWHLNRRHTLRAGVSQAYRTPSMLDWYQFAQVVLPSNGAVLDVISATFRDLKPERVRSAELGYLYQQPRWKSTVDLRLFYEDIDDAISDFRRNLSDFGLTEVGDDEVFENRNSSRWYNRGAELQWQLNPTANQRINLAYGYLETVGTFERNKKVEQPDERSPRHTLSLLASRQLTQDLTLSATYYYLSELFWFKGDSTHYRRLDARLAQAFRLGRHQASLELIGQNLLGDDYLEFERNNVFDTRLFVRFNLKTP